MSYLYIVKVIEDGETMEYEYGNLKHAKEHFDTDKANDVELLEYCWNSASGKGTYRVLEHRK